MKRVFFKYNDLLNSYCVANKKEQTANFELQNLKIILETKNPYKLHLTQSDNKIILWSSDKIKQQASLQFNSKEKNDEFSQTYSQYSNKRWHDMPKLEITLQNYEMIIQKWNEIINSKPEYIIFSQDNVGYVDLIGKDELSAQDLADMKIEHEKYLKYKTAYDKYTKSRPDITDDLWYGPDSSEYEADWQKFLDEPLD